MEPGSTPDTSRTLRYGDAKDLASCGANITTLVFEREWEATDENLKNVGVIIQHCRKIAFLEVFVTPQGESSERLLKLLFREMPTIRHLTITGQATPDFFSRIHGPLATLATLATLESLKFPWAPESGPLLMRTLASMRLPELQAMVVDGISREHLSHLEGHTPALPKLAYIFLWIGTATPRDVFVYDVKRLAIRCFIVYITRWQDFFAFDFGPSPEPVEGRRSMWSQITRIYEILEKLDQARRIVPLSLLAQSVDCILGGRGARFVESLVVQLAFVKRIHLDFRTDDFFFFPSHTSQATFLSVNMGHKYPRPFLVWVSECFPNLTTLYLHGKATVPYGYLFPTLQHLVTAVHQSIDFWPAMIAAGPRLVSLSVNSGDEEEVRSVAGGIQVVARNRGSSYIPITNHIELDCRTGNFVGPGIPEAGAKVKS